jgi:hypothetical protein
VRDREAYHSSIVCRGAAGNPKNRFERIEVEPEPGGQDENPPPETVYLRDHSRSIIARNDSPDIGFVADHIAQLFEIGCRRAGIERGRFPKLITAAFRRAGQRQASLFD